MNRKCGIEIVRFREVKGACSDLPPKFWEIFSWFSSKISPGYVFKCHNTSFRKILQFYLLKQKCSDLPQKYFDFVQICLNMFIIAPNYQKYIYTRIFPYWTDQIAVNIVAELPRNCGAPRNAPHYAPPNARCPAIAGHFGKKETYFTLQLNGVFSKETYFILQLKRFFQKSPPSNDNKIQFSMIKWGF